ncbi:hypothetical protein M3Y97_00331700 [Aphelenchoides bicaudatus]|nr:hypothetical protein M3Y97_00331700 [Aphelenchoides bicaudatus]
MSVVKKAGVAAAKLVTKTKATKIITKADSGVATLKANCAVFGAGLTKSGALASRALVMEPTSPSSMLRPLRIVLLNEKKIRKVAAGLGFSLFASSSALYGSGLNNFYQLGGPERDEEKDSSKGYFIAPHPIPLPNNPTITSVAAGRLHSLIGTSDGVYAFGDNQHGQCGQDPTKNPVVLHSNKGELPRIQLPTDSKCKQVHCTLDSSFVLLENGDLYSFGLSTDGQLGTGCADIEWTPTKVQLDQPVRLVAGSGDTLVAVTNSGELYVWGQTEYNQMSKFTDEPQLFMPFHARFDFDGQEVRSAAATNTSCIVSTEDGRVYTWGSMFLGSGPLVQESQEPLLLSPNLFSDSRGRSAKVRRVAAGICTVAAINEADNLFMWGTNRFGNLALGHDKDQFFPFQVFLPHSVEKISLGPVHSLIITDIF